MNEKELPMGLETQAQVEQPSAGKLLRQAREAAGLHVAGLASALKVPVHKLEALESDDYAAFADTVFMRALAASVCRSLRLDPALILDKLPRSEPKGLAAQPMQLNAPIKERAGSGVAHSSPVSRKALGAVLALLLGAALVYFMPYGALDDGAEGDGSLATLHQPVEVTPAPAAALPAVQLEPALLAEPEAIPSAAAPTAPFVAETPVSATASVPAAVDAVAAAPQLPGQAPLVFNASAPSWVQVKDARGTVVLSKNLSAGESVQVSVQLPVQVVVGRVAVTTLQVRGQPFDLAAVAQGKDVARFEVK